MTVAGLIEKEEQPVVFASLLSLSSVRDHQKRSQNEKFLRCPVKRICYGGGCKKKKKRSALDAPGDLNVQYPCQPNFQTPLWLQRFFLSVTPFICSLFT
jgi:hypothetical protein